MRFAGSSSLRASIQEMEEAGCERIVSMANPRAGLELIAFVGFTAYELMPSTTANAKMNWRRGANGGRV
jgi:hypothetical protein